jgi:hypothetical protein
MTPIEQEKEAREKLASDAMQALEYLYAFSKGAILQLRADANEIADLKQQLKESNGYETFRA